MPSLTKKENSPYWYCCFTTPDGKRTKRSTKQTDKKKAIAVCTEFEKATKKAKKGALTENQAIKVVSDIKSKITNHNQKTKTSPILNSRIPDGLIAEKWDKHRFNLKLVNPANKRKYEVIVVGSG
ncbi:MAG: hypothetical protein CMO77_06105, partial [Verrucomicrobiales bacterium]|nr:hypothetical protein [Verrucomicrobiales bacterium]